MRWHFNRVSSKSRVLVPAVLLLLAAVQSLFPASVSANKPYFKVTGGDVVAGASMATDKATPCDAAQHITSAGVVSWNSHGTPDYGGAGGQYAAYALNYVQDFVTDQGNNPASAGRETNALTFANVNDTTSNPNSVNPGAGLFGGMFGGVSACADYWNAHPSLANQPKNGNPGTWASDTYYIPGGRNFRLGGGPPIGSGTHITLYVDGDVAITKDITYRPGETYADRSQIPSFQLIVHGVIYIDPGVTKLDGLYAAIPDPGGYKVTNNFNAPIPGTITTCSDAGNFRPYDPGDINNVPIDNICANPLTFNGSVVAQQIWLLRNYGKIDDRTPAEVFNYTPEIWLSQQNGTTTYSGQYQNIIGLPPIL